jgi:CO/xanthine dehydrogenase FAD-binding subunit
VTSAEFFRPTSTEEACSLLERYGADASILAGGTDLMVAVNQAQRSLEVVVHLGSLGLDSIHATETDLVLGATATHTEIARSPLVRDKVPLLAEAALSIGSPAIRNMGTIGGNVANASPAADGSVALLALRARVKLVSTRGERIVELEDFFTNPGESVLQPDELLQEVMVPIQDAANQWRWRKLGQRKGSVCAVISLAVALRMEADTCRHARIAMGTVATTPLLASRAGEILSGQRLDERIAERAIAAASESIPERDGARATAWYRRRICEVTLRRFLSPLCSTAGEVN